MPYYKRPSTDANHLIVVTACGMYFGGISICNPYGVRRFYVRDHPAELHDMSKAGGEMTDWMVIIDDVVIFIEVKVEREPAAKSGKGRPRMPDEQYYTNSLTDGESSFFEHSTARRRICVNEEQVRDFILETVDYIECRQEDFEYNGRGWEIYKHAIYKGEKE